MRKVATSSRSLAFPAHVALFIPSCPHSRPRFVTAMLHIVRRQEANSPREAVQAFSVQVLNTRVKYQVRKSPDGAG